MKKYTESLLVRVSPKLHEEIKQAAKADFRSVSAWCRQAADEAAKRAEKAAVQSEKQDEALTRIWIYFEVDKQGYASFQQASRQSTRALAKWVYIWIKPHL